MSASTKRKVYLVEVQRRSEDRDTAGQQLNVWTTVRKEWAAIEQVRGQEYFNASGERATITNKIRVPFASQVRARDRLKLNHDGTLYDVKSVIIVYPDLELMCIEVA